jgi:tetratricopeptide (TPR) repeat protein
MGQEPVSQQDLIQRRRQTGFVGRHGEVARYQENLGFPADDECRMFLFSIHGEAGVGKTSLTQHLQGLATRQGALTAYINETVEDPVSAMSAIARQFGDAGGRMSGFEKRAAAYRRRRHELASDPAAPDGIAAFLTMTAVTVGLEAARDIPVAGSLLTAVDPAATAEQVNRARTYIARRFRDHGDARLLLSPADELTPVFLAGLNQVAARRPVALFIDTYERTGLVLEDWLVRLYAGRYGGLPVTLVTTIAGQKPLDRSRWGACVSVIADVPLEPFSDAEARQFLGSRNIHDENAIRAILSVSGRLPMWLETLAAEQPADAADIGDPAGDAVDRFLEWEDDARQRFVLSAALPRVINQNVLAELGTPSKAAELFGWLRRLPFVTERNGVWEYHQVVRAAMLRLQRAQAPIDWKERQITLAQAYERWAGGEVGEAGREWENPRWIDHTREQMYHLICASPDVNLPLALASAAQAAARGPVRAHQWAELIADAGRDTEHDGLRWWGQRLHDGIRDNDMTQYLTDLIRDGNLAPHVMNIALDKRAECYWLMGRNDETLADLNRAIKLSPGNGALTGARGVLYLITGRYGEALADLARANELSPDNASVIFWRGRACYVLGRYEEALAEYTRADELSPDRAPLIGARGQTYQQLQRYEEALADLTRAIDLDPGLGWVLSSRGRTYRQLGRYEEALADFTRVIDLDPGNATAISFRGQTYQQAGRYEEALADLTRAIDLDPGNSTSIGVRGQTYMQMERYEEALADITRAIDLDSGDVMRIASRGVIYGLMERNEEALADFTRAIDLDPDIAWIIRTRGRIYQRMKRYGEALADLTRAIDLDPGNSAYIAERAEITQLIGDGEDA